MNNHKERIQLHSSLIDVLISMSEGNPGAATCLAEIVKCTEQIDKDSSLAHWGALTTLDSLEIYGSSIWVLYSDICGKSVPHMLAVLRAVNLGEFSGGLLQEACSRQDRSGKELVPVQEIYTRIKTILPNFHITT